MTTKYDNFIAELRALCKKHHVCLDFGYDGCEVWDMRVDDPVSNTGFWQEIEPEDRTRGD
jgi:hypothetical protein